ncbi:uncharacterized protein LOC100199896 isoform X3 [Hydra vulgaris]|uniref:Uncharacterized protein LOC100199896 isoform X3 n=1 Tax=Hydra vulgaris TaxID=6087 RepID=A0ABM4D902_HYDVU
MSSLYIFLLTMVISIQCQTTSIEPSLSTESSVTDSSILILSDTPQISVNPSSTTADQISSIMVSTSYGSIYQATETLDATLTPSTSLLDATMLSSDATMLSSQNTENLDATLTPSTSLLDATMLSSQNTDNSDATSTPSTSLLDATMLSSDATMLSSESTKIDSNSIMATPTVSDTASVDIEALLIATTANSLTYENLIQQPVMIKTSFALTNTWNASLNNTSSQEYIALKTKVINGFNDLYASDPDYINTTLTNFAPGSIIVNVIINFAPQTTTASAETKKTALIQAFSQNTFASFAIVANSMNITLVTNGEWSAWEDVTGNCVNSLKSQIRVCISTGEGSPCVGSNSQTIPCTSSSSVSTTLTPYSLLSLLIVTTTIILS